MHLGFGKGDFPAARPHYQQRSAGINNETPRHAGRTPGARARN
jgi:hypothetical protein